jgi:putative NIF3 family GTP cyclohydrolase 1 type 2
VEEYRLETIIPARNAASIIQRMQAAHPYEEVAYDLFPLANQPHHFSLGRIGSIEPVKLAALASDVKQRLNIPFVRVVGDLEQVVSRIAVVSGAGASFLRQAHSKRCDVLLTGDLKYHEAMTARELGIAVIDAGHYGTEHIVVDLLQERLERGGLDVEVFSARQQECMQIV